MIDKKNERREQIKKSEKLTGNMQKRERMLLGYKRKQTRTTERKKKHAKTRKTNEQRERKQREREGIIQL